MLTVVLTKVRKDGRTVRGDGIVGVALGVAVAVVVTVIVGDAVGVSVGVGVAVTGTLTIVAVGVAAGVRTAVAPSFTGNKPSDVLTSPNELMLAWPTTGNSAG